MERPEVSRASLPALEIPRFSEGRVCSAHRHASFCWRQGLKHRAESSSTTTISDDLPLTMDLKAQSTITSSSRLESIHIATSLGLSGGMAKRIQSPREKKEFGLRADRLVLYTLGMMVYIVEAPLSSLEAQQQVFQVQGGPAARVKPGSRVVHVRRARSQLARGATKARRKRRQFIRPTSIGSGHA